MKKAQKFVAECGGSLQHSSTSSMSCGGDSVYMSKAAYRKYKQKIKASSMFKTTATANTAYLYMVKVQIPKIVDSIKNMPSEKRTNFSTQYDTFEDVLERLITYTDKLTELNDKNINTKKGRLAVSDVLYSLGSICHYINDKKILTLYDKIAALNLEYRKFIGTY